MFRDTLIQVEHLHRYYGPLHAVQDINFSLNRGEVLGFLGPNGAGKSTTMQMLSGNLAPSAGRILINGHDILDEPIAANASLGYLPEQPPLYRELTVIEYLEYCARLNRIPKSELAKAIDRAGDRCGLTEVGKRLIGNLSKGYQQRVGIARAVVNRPPLLLADEPTGNLDPELSKEIMQLFEQFNQVGVTVLIATHDHDLISRMDHRLLTLKQGRLDRDGSTADLIGETVAAVGGES